MCLGGHFVVDEILDNVVQQYFCFDSLSLFETDSFDGGVEIIKDFDAKYNLLSGDVVQASIFLYGNFFPSVMVKREGLRTKLL